jgi:transporter family-2 protein
MNVLLALVGAGTSGSLLGIGSAANARLKGALHSPIAAAAINFIVGFIMLLLGMAIARTGLTGIQHWAIAPWWAFLGGLMGAAFVTLNTLTVPRLGLTTTTLTVVVSQLVMSLVMDQLGWFGIAPHPISSARMIAIIFLVVAIALTQFDRPATPHQPQ